jgi:hypothetical protein
MRLRTAFHVGNTGSNPVGDTINKINGLEAILSPLILMDS